MSLFNELKRRNVFKVAIAYIVMAWLVMQVSDVILNNITAPTWVFHVLMLFLGVGFPFAIFFAWAFELTPEGLKLEKDVDRSKSITQETSRKLDFIIIGVLVVALGYFTYDKFVLSAARESALVEAATQAVTEQAAAGSEAAVEPDKSIAVLPFVNMSSDEEQEYFSDGLSEELLNLLAKIPALRVIARTSSFAYKGTTTKITDVARELNVAYVLEGSVRKAGTQVRITAQLIRANDSSHLWSETYDRSLENIFAIQDEIASAVVAELKVTLLGEAPTVQETNPEAYALFLQGRHLRLQNTAAAYEQAIKVLQQALTIDPDYAAVWVQLGHVYSNQTGMGLRPPDEGYALALEATNKALGIDPAYALAHSSLGFIANVYDNDMASSARHYERALQLDPANIDIIIGASFLTQALGRLDDAIALGEYVVAHDPVNAAGHGNLGLAYSYAGRWDESIASLRTALTLSPGRGSAHYQVGIGLLFKGEPQAALVAVQEEIEDEEYRIKGTALALHALGQQAEFEVAFTELRERWGERWPSEVAQVYAMTGDTEAAFAWLDKAVEQNEDGLAQQFLLPFYQPLYTDPRWAAFRERTGTSEAQLKAIEFKITLPE